MRYLSAAFVFVALGCSSSGGSKATGQPSSGQASGKSASGGASGGVSASEVKFIVSAWVNMMPGPVEEGKTVEPKSFVSVQSLNDDVVPSGVLMGSLSGQDTVGAFALEKVSGNVYKVSADPKLTRGQKAKVRVKYTVGASVEPAYWTETLTVGAVY